MGEYCTIKTTGQQVKMGTCESLYYLRFDQRDLVIPEAGWPDIYRYRFPFPDEDTRPLEDMQAVRDFERGLTVYGVEIPEDVEHYSVQFRNDSIGYNVCLPCPESVSQAADGFGAIDVGGLKVHRNGFKGRVQLVSQRFKDGKLMLVLRCACGAMWRLETLEDAEPVLVALRSEADRKVREAEMAANRREIPRAEVEQAGAWYHDLADRITAGYADPQRKFWTGPRQTVEA